MMMKMMMMMMMMMMLTRLPSGEMCDIYSDVQTSQLGLDTFKSLDTVMETGRKLANSADEEFEKLYKVKH